jgi:hypothetical protein
LNEFSYCKRLKEMGDGRIMAPNFEAEIGGGGVPLAIEVTIQYYPVISNIVIIEACNCYQLDPILFSQG